MTEDEQRIEEIRDLVVTDENGQMGITTDDAKFLLAQYDSLLADKKRLLENLITTVLHLERYHPGKVATCEIITEAKEAIAHSQPEEPK